MVPPGNPRANGTQRTLLNQGNPIWYEHYGIPAKEGKGKGKRIWEKLPRTELATSAWLEICRVGERNSKGRAGQGRAGQGRAGQGRVGRGREGKDDSRKK